MTASPLFVYSDALLAYRFSEQHPFNQFRLTLTIDLLKRLGALSNSEIVAPRRAEDAEIALVHDKAYIEAVKKAGRGELSEPAGEGFGLGTEDTPMFAHMHEASASLVGGTLTAADLVMTGKTDHALHLGGGLHHGLRGKAAGFCIYNDSAVAIRYLQETYKARVLYVDTDAHHGDGVQWTFYDDPDVATYSIHETGRYLFPGTGNVNERGHGHGYGYSFNVPLDAFTEDESWLECYETSLREVAHFFKPDVIVTQNGADAHYYDPLTHLSATMEIYRRIPALAHELAHEYCDGRWIAVGGGGYDIWRVVPRAWSLLWLEMTGQQDKAVHFPKEWIDIWQAKAPHPLPASWDDPPDLYEPIPRKPEITEANQKTVEKLLYPLRNGRS